MCRKTVVWKKHVLRGGNTKLSNDGNIQSSELPIILPNPKEFYFIPPEFTEQLTALHSQRPNTKIHPILAKIRKLCVVYYIP